MPRRIRVFVASPEDVVEESNHVQDVVARLNRSPTVQELDLVIELVRWDTHTRPSMGTAQSIVHEQLEPDSWDIFIGILWLKFGTPTGTEEEFQIAYERYKARGTGWPRIMFYWCTRSPDDTSMLDTEQLNKVQKFFRGFSTDGSHSGLYKKYNKIEEFDRVVHEHLDHVLHEYRSHHSGKREIAQEIGDGQHRTVEVVNPDLTDIGWSEHDQRAIDYFISKYDDDRRESLTKSDDSMLIWLRRHELIGAVAGNHYFTRDGALLFGPQDLLKIQTDVYVSYKNKNNQLVRLEGLCLMQLAQELIRELAPLWQRSWEEPEKRDGSGKPIKVSLYPETAIVEAAVNLIIHRDYTSSEKAYVNVDEDTLVFINPGISQYDVDNVEAFLEQKELERRPYERNSRVIQTFTRTGLNQTQRGGIRRILEALEENGNKKSDGSIGFACENSLENNTFTVKLWAANNKNTVSGDIVAGGDFVGRDQIIYQVAMPAPLDEEALVEAKAKLAQMPLDSISPVGNLPPGSRMPLRMNPLFIGRETELRALAGVLKGGGMAAVSQVVAATGLGGIGKTQIAVAFVHHYGQFFAGGVYWLNFSGPGAIAAEVAACGAMMIDMRADFATLDLETQVRLVMAAWQSPLPRLLVFDNCEDESLLAQWRPPTGGSRVLVTSRRHSWEAGLGVQVLALDVLRRGQSVELLRKFRPDLPVNEPLLDEIATELGDLPLALHMAGSYLARYSKFTSPVQYLAQLRATDLLHHRSLQAGGISPTGHIQDVGRSFALTYEKLQPDNPLNALALALLARAVWFAPGQMIPRTLLLACVELEDGEEGALQSADALEQLANLGLLEMTAAGDLLVHRLVAQFVQRADVAMSEEAQQAVAAALLDEANAMNAAGLPGPLLAWQSHLRHITEAVQGQGNEVAAGLCNTLGFHLDMIGDYEAARPYYERALAIRREVLGAKHPDTATSLNNLGALLKRMGAYEAARPYYERALTIWEEVLGAKHPDTATSLNNLGALLLAQGEYEAARPYYERALAIYEEVLGAKHPDTARSLNNLGYLLEVREEHGAARPYYERALAIQQEVLGAKHPHTATSLTNLGGLLDSMGEYGAARPYYERALAIQQEVLGDKHPDTAGSLNNLGALLHAQGEYEAARSYYERALAIREEVLGDKHPDTATSLNNLGYLLDALGNYVAARPYYERALAILQAALGSTHPTTKVVQDNLVALEEKSGSANLLKLYGRPRMDMDTMGVGEVVAQGPGVKAEGVKSRSGGLTAVDETGRGVDVRGVEVETDVELRSTTAARVGAPGGGAGGPTIKVEGVTAGRDVRIEQHIHEAPKPRIPLERPARVDYFQDRKDELAQLLGDLQPGKVATVCGPGGMGKSALAAEAVWSLAGGDGPPERFPDGILFHTFYGRNQVALALEHVARSFGEELKPTLKEAAQRALSGRRVLLLLDGTEEVDDLRPLLDIRNQCGVLITSRSRKDAVAGRQDLAPLPLEDAVALLQAWGGQWADDRVSAQGICQLVGRLPLALRLVGRYLATYDEEASTYRSWLEATPLVALDQGKRQEESVPLLLKRSLERVSEVARQVLGVVGLLALAPFEGMVIGEGLGLAESAMRPALGELVNYGLLVRRGEHYEVSHALIHTYARERLGQGFDSSSAEPDEVVGRLGAYFEREFAAHAQEFGYLNGLRPHGMALLRVAGESEAWEVVNDLAQAIEDYLDLQGYWAERVAAIETGLAAARGRQNRQAEGAWLGKLGLAYYSLGQVERAIGLYEQALVIAKEIGDRSGEGSHLGNLGLAYRALGQVERAIGFFEQALVIAKEIGDRRGEGERLGNLGLAYRVLGQVERAIGYHEQGLVIAKEIGDRRGEGNALGNLGIAYRALGQVERAIGYHEQGLAIAQEIGDRRVEGNALGNLGLAYWSLGQVERAIGYHEQALVISKEIGDRRGEGADLGNLGLAYADLGQVEQAIGYYEQGLVIAKEIGDRRGEGERLGNLGLAYKNLGQVERAIGFYEQGLVIAKEIGDRRGEGNALGNLGLAYRALGQVERAIGYHEQALVVAKEIGDRSGEGNHLGNLGLAYRALGQVERAIGYHEQALVISKEIGYRRGEGVWLDNLGVAYADLGQVERAIGYHEQALVISKEIGDRRGGGSALGNLGNAYHSLGQMDRARGVWEEALVIFEEIKSPGAAGVRQKLESLKE